MKSPLRDLNVCFLAGCLSQGGAERQLYYYLRALSQAKARVHLMCLTANEFWEEPIRRLGVPITWVGERAGGLNRLRRIMKQLRRDNPDVVQSQHFYTNVYLLAAARGLRLNEIGALRNDVAHEISGRGAALRKICLHSLKHIAVNSRAAVEKAASLGVPRRRLTLLPNVVDAEQFRLCPREPRQPFRILAAGRLVEQKRFDRLLTILHRMKIAGPWTATIVGSGPMRDSLEATIGKLGLAPFVRILEPVADMSVLYRQSDALALSSDHEGTPNVVLEAMASGLPVVSTRVGDVPEIVQDGDTGFLVETAEEQKFADRLSALAGDAGLRERLGLRAREFVLQQRSMQALPGLLGNLYDFALN